MNYANKNEFNDNKCSHCDNNIAKHAINIIRSDDATIALAKKMQALLDDIYRSGLVKRYVLPGITDDRPYKMVMTGAIIATVVKGTNRRQIKAAALSGDQAYKLTNMIKRRALGEDVAILSENVRIAVFQSILGLSISKMVGAVDQLRMPDPAYPVGSCAAQKLVNYVIQSLNDGEIIEKIYMSEIYWKTGSKSDWSTNDPVPSCNTCNYILPMMLCNYDDEGNRIRYPYDSD